ncbi:MAG: hypothetical protein ACTS41_00880 [Candidatus Hodgkinia cicadicola]
MLRGGQSHSEGGIKFASLGQSEPPCGGTFGRRTVTKRSEVLVEG